MASFAKRDTIAATHFQTLKVQVEALEEQREMILWKFKSIPRDEIDDLLTDYKKFDLQHRNLLDEHEAMMFFEHRGNTKTAQELRKMFSEFDANNDHLLSFVELFCGLYGKKVEEFNDFATEEERQAALEACRKSAEDKRKAEMEIEAKRLREEEAARKKAEELEAESRLTGVEGKKAFFKRQVENSLDKTKSNEQIIKEEAALRKQLREAKLKEKQAIEAAQTQRTKEDVEREIRDAALKKEQEDAALEAKKKAEELEERRRKKEALNAKWSKDGGQIPNGLQEKKP
jgi:hypothetical protein